MREIFGAKKTVPLVIIILLLSFITLFLIVEFRFLKQTIEEYQSNIQNIADKKTTGFIEELNLTTKNQARYLEQQEDPAAATRDINNADDRILETYIIEPERENKAFQNELTGILNQKSIKEGDTYIFTKRQNRPSDTLFAATPLTRDNPDKLIILEYNISDFKKEIYEQFIQPQFKIAVFDDNGQPVVWPFPTEELDQFNTEHVEFKSSNLMYEVNRKALPGTSLYVYFFDKIENFDTYRILSIMFLLFALYFLIYQFLVEFWQASSTRSYFENIDFDILNHLREGIIIANRFNRIIFANTSAHGFFPEKHIDFKKTNLKEILGQMGESNQKFTLKKSDRSLEIIRSPIFKNGKMLGSLVVISQSTEKEKLCALTFGRLIELLKDGIIFVDHNNKINTVNMMAQYHLGKIEKGMDINDINSELVQAVNKQIGSHSVHRVPLSLRDIIAELTSVHFQNGSYAGTLIILKESQDSE